jgi:hypothetical protein
MTQPLRPLAALIALAIASAAATAQAAPPAPKPDTAYQTMQQRGQTAMGVDQYTSKHVFDDLPDGGRIELQADSADAAGVAEIRKHFAKIAVDFKAGDFSSPQFVHAQTVTGTGVMAAKRAEITYTVKDLPHGAELIIATKDPAAVTAIHEFLSFQRHEHHAGGMTH